MKKIDTKRIGIFLLVAFGYSWLIALIIYLTGGITNSKPIADGLPLTWVIPLLVLYMFGPTLGNLIARLITREGWQNMGIRPKIKLGWPYWLIAWILTPLMVLAGAGIFFLIYPANFSSEFLSSGALPGMPANTSLPFPPQIMIAVGLLTSILLSPIANLLPVLGEEFGWRGYLQPKLLPLGERATYVLMGIIWGTWHWPVIWMGYNFPGYPILGSLAMIWFCFVLGTFLGWATLRSKSIWPAVIGHGAMNSVASFAFLFSNGENNPLLGPTAVGFIASIFFTFTAAIILWKAKPMAITKQQETDLQPI